MVGIMPIQLPPGIKVDDLGLDGSETFDILASPTWRQGRKW